MELSLVAMNETDFTDFRRMAIPAYAGYKTENGDWRTEESIAKASDEFERLLPDGLGTNGHHFRDIYVNQLKVGYCWFAERHENAEHIVYLYEIAVVEAERNKGYGSETLRLFVKEAKALAADRIMLHVFGYNRSALKLYQRLGFTITDYTMAYRFRNV